MSNKYIVHLFLGAILFQGCASLSQEECKQGDWLGIGYEDGSKGYQESRFNKHREACAEYKISADFAAYQQGRQRGLEQVYCKPRNGYYAGLNGHGYGNVCPSSMEGQFLAAYRYGHDIYRIQQDASRINNELRNSNTRITELDQQIEQLKQQLQHGVPSQSIRHHIKDELKELTERLDRKMPKIITSLHLNHSQKRVHTLLKLAMQRGNYQAQLDWLLEYGRYVRNSNAHHLQNRIRDLDRKISDLKAQLNRQARGEKPVQTLNYLITLAEYTGILESQQKILRHLRGQQQGDDFARFHYSHELAEIKNQAHRHRQAGTPAQAKSRQQIRHELRQARRQRDSELRLVDDLNHQLAVLHQDIRHRKATSPYR